MKQNHFIYLFVFICVLFLGISFWMGPKIKENLDTPPGRTHIAATTGTASEVEAASETETVAETEATSEAEDVSETEAAASSNSENMSDQSNLQEPAPDEEVAVISTDQGDMVIAFWPDVAPKTVENFKKLANEKFYDGTAFHRIIKGFMIQGGCPFTKEGARGMPGTGDPGYKIKAEFNDRPHVRGVISMARSQDPNSAGSQFFIVHGDARFLDNQYTAFGKLVDGDDVLEKIATAAVKPDGRENSTPANRMGVNSIRIVAYKDLSGNN